MHRNAFYVVPALALFLVLLHPVASLTMAADRPPQVRLQTSLGEITVELDPVKAHETTANFIQYVRDGFYDGTVFHRVIPGFMIQGGGFTADMRQKATRPPIPNEADNGLENRRGSIAMARTAAPHSATAQFFINLTDNAFLNHRDKTTRGWGYCVFGRVVQGMDVVDAIAGKATHAVGMHQNVPVEPIVINKAEMSAPASQAEPTAEKK